MEYIIDTELLRKEIEKNKNMIDWLFTEGDDSVYDGENDAYNRVLRIIDSLQQEQQEVELEEEINRFWDSCIKHKNERGGNVIRSNKIEVEVLARYFYELGLKAGKGEQI